MHPSDKNVPIKVFLTSDIRFGKPDVMNDHVWSLETHSGDPAALSLFTTYGLRARRMRFFPRFKIENSTAVDPAGFYEFPLLHSFSTNACSLIFSPFQNVDVQLDLWVPTSQIIVGQMKVFNSAVKSINLSIDWLMQMNPHGQGIPFIPVKVGLNQVLHGETNNLHPLFYLTGGPEESNSEYPGLGITMRLVPDAEKQVTWVLSSLDSIDSSFFYARQYSSKVLEIEFVKNEITDQFQMVHFSTYGSAVGDALSKSQTRAFQLVVPPTGLLRHNTFVLDRTPDTGFFYRTDMMDLSREWTGQTTLDAWYMAQFLLPGCPDVLKDIIQNFIDAQEPDGFIDFRVSVNRRKTGILATPVLISLVDELYPYLDDSKWLAEIFPSLVLFLKKWENATSNSLNVHGIEWLHPVQTGMYNSEEIGEEHQIKIWSARKSGQDVYLASLLFHEAKSLQHLSKLIGIAQEDGWLTRFMSRMKTLTDSVLENKKSKKGIGDGQSNSLKVIASFKNNGDHIAVRKISRPGRLLLKITPVTRLSPNFACKISGFDATGSEVSEEVNSNNLVLFGKKYVFISNQEYQTLANITVTGFSKGDIGEACRIEPTNMDVFHFLLSWSGMYTNGELSKMEPLQHFLDYVQEDGIYLNNQGKTEENSRLPNSIAALIIQGLVQQNMNKLASDAYLAHFFCDSSRDGRQDPATGRLEQLPPVRLFLDLLGVRKLSAREIILSYFNPFPWPVALSFNQVRIMTGSEGVEIFTRKGDTIKLTEEKPQRIFLD